ncbi:hypothetical protein ACPV3A_16840 [Paenibacillus sp. Dod16]|uniref:hypothetical protein n=1 Tax=Paenibacillus sp. Dod16 TaxID=3416392 RepID=UPI003CE8493F
MIVNVYNSNYVEPVTIILNSEDHLTIEPKETIKIETNSMVGREGFMIKEVQGQRWIEAYQGRYNQNLILRMEEC